MGGLSLPFKQSLATKLQHGGSAFEIDVPAGGGTAITGTVVGNDPVGSPGNGIVGHSDAGNGVYGASSSGTGVAGYSGTSQGVYGNSAQFDAVVGETTSDAHAGVTGRNLTTGANGGVGIYGTGGMYAGKFDGNVVIASKDQNFDALNAQSSSKQHAGVSASNSGGGFGLWAYSPTGVGVYGKGGTYAGQFDGNVQVNGDHHCLGQMTVDKDIVLTAADCAEEFNINADDEVDPGTVMVFDETASLRISHVAYDTKVAGVISGAGDYRPGLILDKGNSEHKRMPVALMGKVYCKVDAEYGPIEVGDLLTTSPTPGHAMRAGDPFKAFGSVIGKAMRTLKCGRGLIPVLVGLQ